MTSEQYVKECRKIGRKYGLLLETWQSIEAPNYTLFLRFTKCGNLFRVFCLSLGLLAPGEFFQSLKLLEKELRLTK